MKVTNVTVFKVDTKSKLKALVRVVLDDALQLTKLRIYEGSNGLFVSYPSDTTEEQDYRQIFYPISKELRDHIEEVVVAEYNKEVKKEVAIHDNVSVDPGDDNGEMYEAFSGTVVGIKTDPDGSKLIDVEDMDGDVFSCEPEHVSLED
jgi:stage V sporulation protein G